MSYEQLADQDKGGKEALRLISHKIKQAKVLPEPDPPMIVDPHGIDVQKGVRLLRKVKRGRLGPQDIERSLYRSRMQQQTAPIVKEFNGLGAVEDAVKIGTKATADVLKLLTGGAAQKEEAAKKQKLPFIMIGGIAGLVFLTYLLFFRKTRINPESYSVKAAKHVSKSLAKNNGDNIEKAAQKALAEYQSKHKAPKKKKSKSRRRRR